MAIAFIYNEQKVIEVLKYLPV